MRSCINCRHRRQAAESYKDAIDGGTGTDVAVYSGSRQNYVLTKTASGFTVTNNSGLEGTDTLQTVERLKFSDRGIALDVGTTQ